MIAARAMGANTARVLEQTTSGDVTGDKRGYIVGYLAAVFYSEKAHGDPHEYALEEPVTEQHDITDHRTLESDQTLNAGEREMLRRDVLSNTPSRARASHVPPLRLRDCGRSAAYSSHSSSGAS